MTTYFRGNYPPSTFLRLRDRKLVVTVEGCTNPNCDNRPCVVTLDELQDADGWLECETCDNALFPVGADEAYRKEIGYHPDYSVELSWDEWDLVQKILNGDVRAEDYRGEVNYIIKDIIHAEMQTRIVP